MDLNTGHLAPAHIMLKMFHKVQNVHSVKNSTLNELNKPINQINQSLAFLTSQHNYNTLNTLKVLTSDAFKQIFSTRNQISQFCL